MSATMPQTPRTCLESCHDSTSLDDWPGDWLDDSSTWCCASPTPAAHRSTITSNGQLPKCVRYEAATACHATLPDHSAPTGSRLGSQSLAQIPFPHPACALVYSKPRALPSCRPSCCLLVGPHALVCNIRTTTRCDAALRHSTCPLIIPVVARAPFVSHHTPFDF